MFVDDLPVWAFVGEHEHEDMLLGHTKNSKHYLYTHLHFSIAYNGNQIIAVNVYVGPVCVGCGACVPGAVACRQRCACTPLHPPCTSKGLSAP
jgi:hypothetical protein